MAQIDFSNATLSIKPNVGLPAGEGYAGLNTVVFLDANGSRINSSSNVSVLLNNENNFTLLYDGTMEASGTEFYIGSWKVSNISFSSGDTYVLQIKGTLTCN